MERIDVASGMSWFVTNDNKTTRKHTMANERSIQDELVCRGVRAGAERGKIFSADICGPYEKERERMRPKCRERKQAIG